MTAGVVHVLVYKSVTGKNGCNSGTGVQWNMCFTGVQAYRSSTGVQVYMNITGLQVYRSSTRV